MATLNTKLSPVDVERENRDLGFGSVVSQESAQRLLNRDGSFNVRRHGLGFWRSLHAYQLLLTMSALRFTVVMAGSFVLINVLFALSFVALGPLALQGNSNTGAGFWRAFFFSIQTFTTIGYGNVVPVGFGANVLASLESFVSLLAVALVAGVLFARFSRPTAKIIYSDHAVIAPYRGITAFQFRIVNGRRNEIIEVQAKLLFSRFEHTDHGTIRQYYQLALEREKVTFFPLTWTVVHPIDGNSPLYGLKPQDLYDSKGEFLILMNGVDEAFAQIVYSRTSYTADEIVWNARFASVFTKHPGGKPVMVDLERFHQIEVLDGAKKSGDEKIVTA
ncbi:MAG TPA: ion channel [Terriglobales bacterium]|jgi:inward rectifier potassium channel|nr:ion channel [Terriglobales bacterium]